MPKLSVYVADELWEKACQVDPLANQSQLVQRGLGCLLKNRPDEPFAPPEGAVARIDSLRATFAAQAQAEYEAGYVGALEAAETLPWFALEDFANAKFDTRRWLDGVTDSAAFSSLHGHGLPRWLPAIAKTLGSLADPIGVDEYSFTPTRSRVRGFGDALRAVWEAVDLDALGLVSTKHKSARTETDNDEQASESEH